MRDVLMEIVQEDVDKRVSTAEVAKERETLVSSIKNVMASFGVSIEKAMDALKIPLSQRDTYASLV